MKLKLNKKQLIAIALVLAVGVVLAGLILGTAKSRPEGEEHGQAEPAGHADAEESVAKGGPRKGAHGGKLFTQDGYGVEVTIFEQGVEPQFRLYTYRDGEPLDPKASQVKVTLERLGREPQVFSFIPEKDYLKGDAVVEEPHSFKVTIAARYDNKAYRFVYEQVEARVAMSDEQLRQNQVEVLTAGPVRIRNVLQLIGEVR
ncbi:MAG: efflux transporter periplasmic adaptor subunit, partial [Pseudomonadota bacterium]